MHKVYVFAICAMQSIVYPCACVYYTSLCSHTYALVGVEQCTEKVNRTVNVLPMINQVNKSGLRHLRPSSVLLRRLFSSQPL